MVFDLSPSPLWGSSLSLLAHRQLRCRLLTNAPTGLNANEILFVNYNWQ